MKKERPVGGNVRNHHSILAHSLALWPSRPKSDKGAILEVNLIDCMKGRISYRTQLVGSGNHPRTKVDSSPCKSK